MIIDVAKDFSRFPAGRYIDDGPYTGERFLHMLLIPALESKSKKVKIILDGTLGYGSSFLEEAFGGVVRLGRWSLVDLQSRIELISSDPNLLAEIQAYMREA